MLDLIEFMGWPFSPNNITVKNATDTWMALNSNEYFYIAETKRLTVLHNFDMNQDYTIKFE
jgi:hypothetical protein